MSSLTLERLGLRLRASGQPRRRCRRRGRQDVEAAEEKVYKEQRRV
jgi:hypothetical protein